MFKISITRFVLGPKEGKKFMTEWIAWQERLKAEEQEEEKKLYEKGVEVKKDEVLKKEMEDWEKISG